MGASYSIVLEKKIENFDPSMDGKALARSMEALEELALLRNVRPLTGFTSVDPAAAADFLLGEGVPPTEVHLPPIQQFSPDEGLATVRALISHLNVQPSAVRNPEAVLMNLRDCERILTRAQQHGVRWHFEVDF
jgi:hypothetical protein